MAALRSPIEGMWVWRGWRDLFGKIALTGTPHQSVEQVLVPVKFTNGQHGIVTVSEFALPGGRVVTHAHEVRAVSNENCNEVIRSSTCMPSIIHVFPAYLRVGVSEGDVDGSVYISRDKQFAGHEKVVFG